MCGVPASASLAEGFRVPSLRRGRGMADEPRATSMPELCPADLANGGDALRGHAQTTAFVVPSDLVFHRPKARSQRLGSAAGSGPGKLPNSLGTADGTSALSAQPTVGNTNMKKRRKETGCHLSRKSPIVTKRTVGPLIAPQDFLGHELTLMNTNY